MLKIPIPCAITSDIVNKLVQSNKFALTKIHIYEESASDVQDDLVESTAPSHGVGCSLSESRIE